MLSLILSIVAILSIVVVCFYFYKKFSNISFTFDLSDYYTKQEVDNLLTSVRGPQGPKEKLDGHDVVELLNDLPEISLPNTKVKADSFYQV